MRILHINDKLTISGGVEVYISQIQELLNGRGIESDWIAFHRVGNGCRIESANPSLEWTGALSDLAASPLGRMVARGQTIFHVHSLSEPKLLDALFAIAPVVRTIHEPRIFCPGQGKYWAKTESICTIPCGVHCIVHAYTKQCCNRHPKRLLRQFANTHYEVKTASHRYAALLANSHYTQEGAREVGFLEETMHLLHYPTYTTAEPQYFEGTNFHIVFSGRLSRTKGLHYLLDAMALVAQQFEQVHLDVLGAGHDEAAFRAQAEALGIAQQVTFHGWADRETIDRVVSEATVVAFPSIYPEAFGISGIEAMMRGKPVVGFDVGGVKDWLRHGETGLLVPVKDTQGFADAVSKLLQDDDLRHQMGRRAREIALAEFSEEVHMQKLIKIYEAALSVD
ncbi:glycosyltransferase family 4 protein [Algibacter sp.]|nr:glycosyltransferase family 4 protein [Algibacter sp.]